MKKFISLLALLPLAGVGYGQAITITATDMPVPASIVNIYDITSSAPANPNPTAAATWNYQANTGTATTVGYTPETDTFFTNAGVDIYYDITKSFNAMFGYALKSEIDLNSTGVIEKGLAITDQGYDLVAVTGTAGDSLLIPAQKSIFSTPKEIIRFPFTANSAWHSVSRRVTNFVLNVPAFFLNYAPCQHVYYIHRDDSVVGYGKMRVYTTAGPSIYYDVLMDKIGQYAVDSFFISGTAASLSVTTAFGVEQGQHTDSSYRYNFYRKGSYNYLMSFFYGADNNYANQQEAYAAKDGITTAGVGVAAHNDVKYMTVLFPNPCTGSKVNLMVSGKNISGCTYTISDVTGKSVAAGAAEVSGNVAHISFTDNVVNGTYILNVQDSEGNVVATEQFSVAK
ncbi:MAG: T9SS type A sorting domain-containing protein [Taibaiella sp.]|nr:T9SS type A sorting domain-containing protein [Taibaiella sp.]